MATNNTDIFGRTLQSIQDPITADKCTINWGGIVTGAINLNLSYSQGITRRHTIGNQAAVIYASQPVGSIQISQLLIADGKSLFDNPGWVACQVGNGGGVITINFAGGCGDNGVAGGLSLTCRGVIVGTFNISAEAEGLTVMDNVGIEFLQLINS